MIRRLHRLLHKADYDLGARGFLIKGTVSIRHWRGLCISMADWIVSNSCRFASIRGCLFYLRLSVFIRGCLSYLRAHWPHRNV